MRLGPRREGVVVVEKQDAERPGRLRGRRVVTRREGRCRRGRRGTASRRPRGPSSRASRRRRSATRSRPRFPTYGAGRGDAVAEPGVPRRQPEARRPCRGRDHDDVRSEEVRVARGRVDVQVTVRPVVEGRARCRREGDVDVRRVAVSPGSPGPPRLPSGASSPSRRDAVAVPVDLDLEGRPRTGSSTRPRSPRRTRPSRRSRSRWRARSSPRRPRRDPRPRVRRSSRPSSGSRRAARRPTRSRRRRPAGAAPSSAPSRRGES